MPTGGTPRRRDAVCGHRAKKARRVCYGGFQAGGPTRINGRPHDLTMTGAGAERGIRVARHRLPRFDIRRCVNVQRD
ncbi:hypothetical protein EMIT0158MI4_40031 [Burkholderia ambifaria]